MIDFIDRTLDVIEALKGVSFPVVVGGLDIDDSIAMVPTAGGQAIETYFDGTKDKKLPYLISIKTKKNLEAQEVLSLISSKLEAIECIASDNESYEFIGIDISDEPFYLTELQDGFVLHQLRIEANLTVFETKEEVN